MGYMSQYGIEATDCREHRMRQEDGGSVPLNPLRSGAVWG